MEFEEIYDTDHAETVASGSRKKPGARIEAAGARRSSAPDVPVRSAQLRNLRRAAGATRLGRFNFAVDKAL